jgi:hypothetical protein
VARQRRHCGDIHGAKQKVEKGIAVAWRKKRRVAAVEHFIASS